MILVGGWGIEETIDRANTVINRVVRKARRLGLEVSASKMEAMMFRIKGKRRVKEREIIMEGERVALQHTIKYLGIC